LVYKKQASPGLGVAIGTPGMYTNILNNYRADKFTEGPIVAAQKMSESLKANNLIPENVLEIKTYDRFIFVCIILFLRSLTIQFTEYFISNGSINTLPKALLTFCIIYSAIFLILVIYINLDTYRLRIIFNYMNLNINSSVIMIHLGLLYMICYGIYTLIGYLNFPIKNIKTVALTDENKAYLMYQLEIITAIVWLLLLMLVFVM
jgi:hypothetical protein